MFQLTFALRYTRYIQLTFIRVTSLIDKRLFQTSEILEGSERRL